MEEGPNGEMAAGGGERQGRHFFRLPGFLQGNNSNGYQQQGATNMLREEPRTPKASAKPKDTKIPDVKLKQCADPACLKDFSFF